MYIRIIFLPFIEYTDISIRANPKPKLPPIIRTREINQRM